MREIIFRGKRIDNGEWVYGSLVFDEINNDYYILSAKSFEADIYEVAPETIGQYTGILNKNGKKIFEGDIVKKETFDDTKPDFINTSYAKVMYIEETGGFHLVNKENKILWGVAEDKYNIKVAGNTTDYPELLEVEDE